jgi:membrane protein implicated in regulation of membrane protease activity
MKVAILAAEYDLPTWPLAALLALALAIAAAALWWNWRKSSRRKAPPPLLRDRLT